MSTPRITHEDLIAYAAGELPPEESSRVATYLEANPTAAETVQRYVAIEALMEQDDSVAPGSDILARAKAIFKANAAVPRISLLERLDAVIATLIFDSRLQPAALRDVQAEERFQLAFESAGAEIDLQVQKRSTDRASSSRWHLIGQVASDAEPGPCPVSLIRSGEEDPFAQTMTDDQGLFELDVDAGRYDLCIELPQQPIVLRDLTLS